VFRIRIGFSGDPGLNPDFHINADSDPDLGNQTNADPDPDPDRTLPSHKV
jgi:hypothetical protein